MLCCYYCCHNIDGDVFKLPIQYNRETNTYTFYGCFCSYECMKTYNLELNDSFTNKRFMYITSICRGGNNSYNNISFAPSKTNLKIFGGKMTIEEFRKGFTKHNNTISNIDTGVSNDIHIQNCIQYQVKEVKNEPVRLKRSKPLKNSQNTLENTMGIFKTCSS
jgi:hypothetical protein